MILAALAAAAVAAAPDASVPPTVSPLTVQPLPKTGAPPAATVEVPTDATELGRWASVWPEAAFQEHISGYVVLRCDIDRHGLAEWCQVATETPANKGFGAAALELRPTFKVKPAMGPDGPIDAVMNIAINFKVPDNRIDWGAGRGGGSMGESAGGPSSGKGDLTMFGGPSSPRHSVSMLNNPVWASTVSYSDVAAAYPAKAGGAEGYAVAHCEVSHAGALSGCQVTKEDPDNRGFGMAALRLASRFRVAPEWARAPHNADLWVDIPVRFPAPGAADSREVSSPYWVAGFDPDEALQVFPKEAAEKGLTTGYGVARCVAAQDGTLSDCQPQPGDPDGLGFSEAAVKLASTMRMNPWQRDGEPVDGAVVQVGVRLNLKP
ncbi:MAG TPA: TonB family protein [Caulobacteraceae bacterium]|nr:TonB family protein [Caulobacteraceae bacterium]